jgi:hypothetical protein
LASPAERLVDLIAGVQGLPMRNKGGIRSLVAKLEAALASLERDNTHTAQNQLVAFANEIAALVPKKISQADAQPLIDEANDIWDQLNEQ